jgi:hypothetical protein
MGASNGNWVSWYVSYASSNVVLGYNPKSKFASDIKGKPWYQVITEPGLKLGFTDPATDPKGKLVAQGLSDTAKARKLPALTTIENDKGDVFPEETLVARLQSGQLDAAFFYTAEAIPAKIPVVPLVGETLNAQPARRGGVRRLPARAVRPGLPQAGRLRPGHPAEDHRHRHPGHRVGRAQVAAGGLAPRRPR